MNWLNIWNSREVKGIENVPKKDVLEGLLEMDGFDSPTGNIEVGAWIEYIDQIIDVLDLESSETIYEVGCGAGAFLYMLYVKDYKVAGLDFSKDLIEVAQKAMPGMLFETSDALELMTSPKSDYIIASSVVFYFPSYEYTEKVLELMYEKANMAIVILDVPDLETQERCENFRRGALSEKEYKMKYAGLMHLYYPKNFWRDFAKRKGILCEIEQQYIRGYCNNEYRYNVILRKG